MTIARLRRIALWLQSRLIDANYDTELTGEELVFTLNVHYYGMGRFKLTTPITLELEPSTGNYKFVIEIANHTEWWAASASITGVMGACNGQLSWSMSFDDKHEQLLATITTNLKLQSASANREFLRRAEKEKAQILKDTWAVHQYSTRELDRAAMHRKLPPPKLACRPSKGKYS